MSEPKVVTTISGGMVQGVAGAGVVHIENLIINNPAAAEPPPADPAGESIPLSPYMGLNFFGPEQADIFFGREKAVEGLAEAVKRRSLTALIGASGSGKSSVVLAGLAPRLHKEGGWRFTHFRIGTADPFMALATALVPLLLAPEGDVVDQLGSKKKLGAKLAGKLASDELTVGDVLADCLGQDSRTRILLIADQFEEVFTAIADERVRQRFIDALLSGLPDTAVKDGPSASLILTMRADFYGRALLYRPLADALQDHVINLGPMDRGELQLAIENPAKARQVSFEPGLVKTLVDGVADKPGTLPLLEFALSEMWGLQERRIITHRSYEKIGGVEGALARRADQVFARFAAEGSTARVEKNFRQLFTRLVTLGEGQEDTRRVVDRAELDDELWALAQDLAGERNRLVVTNAPEFGPATAEVVHEALIRHWPRLRAWIDADRAFQSWLRKIQPDVELWLVDPSDEQLLLRGSSRLGQAQEWLDRCGDDLNESERKFIEASLVFRRRTEEQREAARQAEIRRQQELAEAAGRLANEQRKRARMARNVAIGAAIGTAIAVAIAVFAVDAKREATTFAAKAESEHKVAVARQLATEARLALIGRGTPERSLLLATTSLNFGWTVEGLDAWSNAFALTRRPSILLGAEEGPFSAVTATPDESLIAAAGKASIVFLDGTTLRPLSRLPHERATMLKLSRPDGRLLASSDGARTLVWGGDGEKRLLHELEGASGWAAFDSKGKRVAVFTSDGTARVFDVETWSQILQIGGMSRHGAAFSPDDRWLVSKPTSLEAWDLTRSPRTNEAPATLGDPITFSETRGRSNQFSGDLFSFSHDGQLLVDSGNLWRHGADGDTLSFSRVPFRDFDGEIVAASGDASYLATADSNGPYRIWRGAGGAADAPKFVEAARVPLSGINPTRVPHATVVSVRAKSLIVGSDRLVSWPLSDYGEVAQLQLPSPALALTTRGDYVAATSRDGVDLWKTGEWGRGVHKRIREAPEDEPASAIAFSGDGRWLAATVGSVLTIWAGGTWQEAGSAEFSGPVSNIAFTPDGTQILSISKEGVSITAIGSGKTKRLSEEKRVDSLSVSPDGKHVAITSLKHCDRRALPGSVRVARLDDGAELDQRVEACSQDKPGTATGANDLIADSTGWHIIFDLAEHRSRVWGKLRLVASAEGTWRMTTADVSPAAAPLFARDMGQVRSPILTADGRWIVAITEDGAARVWSAAGGREELIAWSCNRLSENLSEAAWRGYLNGEPYVPACSGLPVAK